MKGKIQLLLILTALVTLLAITAKVFKNNSIENKFPPPIETIVVDREEHHDKKLEWIEQMHRSAPEDNWRFMDMDFRLNNASNKLKASDSKNEVLYGKWKELGSNNMAGRTLVADYDVETNIIYLASDGGQIWKGQPGADNWQSLTDHIKIPAIHFLKRIEYNDGYRFIVGSGRWNIPGLLYSDDDCQTWQVATGLENMESWGYVRRVIMKNDPSEGIYVVCMEWNYTNWNAMSQIYVSHDFGESFAPLTTFAFGADVVDIWTNPYGNNEVYVLAKDELFTLDDLGNLTLIGNIPAEAPEKVILTGACSIGAPKLYALIRYNGSSNFFASFNGGSDWTLKSSKNEGPFMINSFVASPTQLGMVYFGGINASYSHDHGNTWTLVNEWYHYYNSPEDKLHADIPSFSPFIDAEGNKFVLINTDGGIYISYDYLENVSNISMKNLRISQYYSTYTCRFAPDNTHAGAQDQGYQFSNQNADTSVIDYEQLISGDYGHIVSGDEGASVWMDYPGFVMYAPDINNSTALKTWDFVGQNYQWMPRLMADPNDPASVYVAGGRITTGAHLIRVSYHSGQMSYQEEPFDFSNGTDANISALAYSPVDTDYRYVMTTEGDFFYSSDAGSSWMETEGFTGPGSHYFYGASIVASNTNPGLVYVGGSGYSNPGVYKSDHNGNTFEAFDTGLPETLVYNMALSPDDSLLFAATELGAYVCKTWEGQWYELGDSNLPDQAWWSVDYVESLDKVRFASYGRGVWEFDRDPSVEAGFVADKVEIQEGDTINFTDQSLWNPISWEWEFQGANPSISSNQNPSEIIYSETGIFDVKLTVHNHNSIDTLIKENYIEVFPATGIHENENKEDVLIYPNPASDFINIEGAIDIKKIEILDLDGRTHLVNQISSDILNLTKVSIATLPAGIYIIKITSDSGIITKKISKR